MAHRLHGPCAERNIDAGGTGVPLPGGARPGRDPRRPAEAVMEFPFVVIPRLTERQKQRYREHVDSGVSGWHRKWTESVWRRHQDKSNAALSGWTSPQDARRRLIHFYDEYDTERGSF